MTELYIGLMSGTSIDAIDAVLVALDTPTAETVSTHSRPIPDLLRQRLIAACDPAESASIDELGELDARLGLEFATAALDLLEAAGVAPKQVRAIGSHGQTVRHRPLGEGATTLQIADPNRIAELTGITTVADFRRRDIAAGGQGAPLAPAFHAHAFRDAHEPCVVVNVGGMANLTLLPPAPSQAVTGFDTGPGNVLSDAWHGAHRGSRYDDAGAWAASGEARPELLNQLLTHPYFRRTPPKSTGREDFSLGWLRQQLGKLDSRFEPVDVQATVLELTARSISDAIDGHARGVEIVWVCGGGVHNTQLLRRLAALLPGRRIRSSAEAGLDPDWIEAIAFAWLAQRTLAGLPGNEPGVTGASRSVVLGAIYPA
jgi:anhydro-N-acetylmuramic acid kinase